MYIQISLEVMENFTQCLVRKYGGISAQCVLSFNIIGTARRVSSYPELLDLCLNYDPRGIITKTQILYID